MRNTSETDQKRTLSAKLTHPDVGDVGQGKLTFGYSCSATFSFDLFEAQIRPTEAQLAGRRIEADMSIDEAGKRLGMKQQVAYALAKEGLLTTDVDASGRRRVTPDGLVSFRGLYVSLAAIARSLGTSTKSALRRIRARPVCGPGIDANRQYFYRRAEISNELEPRVLTGS